MLAEERLPQRKEAILKIVINEYIRSGYPVASQSIIKRHTLGVGAATIRNELAWLKEHGFLSQPHTSAGAIPSDKGYRYYVNTLAKEDMSPDEQRLIKHLFHQVEMELDEWVKLAASLLAQLARNAALIIPPKAPLSHFKRIHLVVVQELVALLVLILEEAQLRQQLITFEHEITQEQLDIIANKLSSSYSGLTRRQIFYQSKDLNTDEMAVTQATLGIMEAEDGRRYEQPYVEGLRHLLSQPEFVNSANVLGIMDLLDKKFLVPTLLSQGEYNKVSVIIGGENLQDELRDLSLVVSAYGVPNEFTGTIGVVGPKRMQYSRTISAVRFLSSVLGDMASDLRGIKPITDVSECGKT